MVEFSGWVFGSDLMLAMNDFVMLTMGSPDNPPATIIRRALSFLVADARIWDHLLCRPNPSEVLATDLGLHLHPKNSSQILI